MKITSWGSKFDTYKNEERDLFSDYALVAGASEVDRAPKVIQVVLLMSDCIPKVREFRKQGPNE